MKRLCTVSIWSISRFKWGDQTTLLYSTYGTRIRRCSRRIRNGSMCLCIVYDRKVMTVPRMYVLQTGQLRSLGEHWSQETRCPQGRNTVLTSLPMQTLQFTRLGVVKSTILLHQHLLLVVCQQRKFDYVHTFCFLQTLFFISLPPPRRLCFHMCLFCLKQE